MRKNTTKDTQSGFTIIEVLISMGILAVGIMAISLMQAHFAGGNLQSRLYIRATDIAMNQIETLSNINDPSNANLDTGNHTTVINAYEQNFTLSWTVTDNNDGTLTVDLSVSWNDNGRGRTLIFPWVKSI
jgi:prepilin-type N-terminal cleavage/methylation domain-containing protein